MLCAEYVEGGGVDERAGDCAVADSCVHYRPVDPSVDPRHLGLSAYWAIFEHSLDAVMFTVPDGRILAANRAASELFGMTEDEIIAAGRQGLVDATDTGWARAVAERDASGSVRAELRMKRADGSTFVADISSVTFDTPDGKRACVIVRDMTERRELLRRQSHLIGELHQAALIDELTGLRNRRGLSQVAELVMAMAARSGAPLHVLFIDVDGMKQINDGHGHDAGDRALRAVAASIGECLRSSDVAARIGGDEFVVLLSNATYDDAVEVAERFRLSLTHHAAAGDATLTASVGIAHAAADSSFDDLLVRADRQMYQAKQSRREH